MGGLDVHATWKETRFVCLCACVCCSARRPPLCFRRGDTHTRARRRTTTKQPRRHASQWASSLTGKYEENNGEVRWNCSARRSEVHLAHTSSGGDKHRVAQSDFCFQSLEIQTRLVTRNSMCQLTVGRRETHLTRWKWNSHCLLGFIVDVTDKQTLWHFYAHARGTQRQANTRNTTNWS